jgi:5-oxoprolinase (ATP-hydrolysing) subunit A
MRVDVNADVGESFGTYRLGQDPELIPLITSANIACGFHAGDPGVMRATVSLARTHGVAIGAHPSFDDLVGFGRRAVAASPREIEDLVVYQIGALMGVAAAQGLSLSHVKAHGALYNIAAREAPVAAAIARAVASISGELILVGPPQSQLIKAGTREGLRTAAEGFVDRAYCADGSLVARSQPNAIIEDPLVAVQRAVRMVRDRVVEAIDGTLVPLEIDTICVHGDTPGAVALASRLRAALADAGIEVRPLAN